MMRLKLNITCMYIILKIAIELKQKLIIKVSKTHLNILVGFIRGNKSKKYFNFL